MITADIHLPQARPVISLGVLILLLLWETGAPFFQFWRGKDRLRHGWRNVFLGVANAVMTSLVFVGIWLMASKWALKHEFGLLNRISLDPFTEGIIAVLSLDCWTYFWHRLNHRIPFLWRFHRVHHSDAEMDVTTANRFHTGEILMSSVLRIPLIVILGIKIEQLALYEILMFSVVQFHHANISISRPLDRLLGIFIVTPFMHKVHHSRWQPETDSNYSSLLSIWDRLFKSFRVNPNPETLKLGLDSFDSPDQQNFTGLLKTPWKAKDHQP